MVSNRAALAVLVGGRFKGGVKDALSHPDFAGASRHYVDNALGAMRAQAGAEQAAVAAEQQRLAQVEADLERERTDSLDLQCKDDADLQSTWPSASRTSCWSSLLLARS